MSKLLLSELSGLRFSETIASHYGRGNAKKLNLDIKILDSTTVITNYSVIDHKEVIYSGICLAKAVKVYNSI